MNCVKVLRLALAQQAPPLLFPITTTEIASVVAGDAAGQDASSDQGRISKIKLSGDGHLYCIRETGMIKVPFETYISICLIA